MRRHSQRYEYRHIVVTSNADTKEPNKKAPHGAFLLERYLEPYHPDLDILK